jgi:hypothetical protein
MNLTLGVGMFIIDTLSSRCKDLMLGLGVSSIDTLSSRCIKSDTWA